jgi:hypothetical protein
MPKKQEKKCEKRKKNSVDKARILFPRFLE